MTQSEDALIAEVRRLRKHIGRLSSGCFLVEGQPEIDRAAAASMHFRKLIICPELIELDPATIPADEVCLVDKATFAACAFGTRLKGVIGICSTPKTTLDDLQLPKQPLILALESVEKPGNLGAAIRSADGAGVDAVLAVNARTAIYNQHVVRSSLGLLFQVPVVSSTNEAAYEFFVQHSCAMLAATSRGEQLYSDCDLTQPTVLLMGNEHSGLSDFWLERATRQIVIPMNGTGTCLNVTASAAVLLYEAIRQRGGEYRSTNIEIRNKFE